MVKMNQYSNRSTNNLGQCHPVLMALFAAVLSDSDHIVTTGHRGQAKQDKAFREQASKVQWPNSKHNTTPSQAVDVYPFVSGGISFDVGDCRVLGFRVKAMAKEMNIPIIWGGDWGWDFGHYELDVDKYRKTPWFQLYGI